MFFAKYINSQSIIRCPGTGYIGKKAISNLEKFFSRHIKEAEKQGYMEYIPYNSESEFVPEYTVIDGKIIEGVKKIDN